MHPFLYLDADSCDRRLVRALRRHEIDVVLGTEHGMADASDVEQLERAVALERPILTANYKDFKPLQTSWAHEGREHFGVIIWTPNIRSAESVAALVAGVCMSRTAAQLRNSLVWVT